MLLIVSDIFHGMESINTTVDLNLLKGKSVFITGGGSGIGLATARAWAAAGAHVTIGDIKPISNGEDVAESITIDGYKINYSYCDVTDWDSQIAAFRSAINFSPTKTLDVVACFAGTAFAPGNIVDHVLQAGDANPDLDPKAPDTRNLEINLKGLYYTSWLALYFFRLQNENLVQQTTSGELDAAAKKSLILVSSIGGYMDSSKASTYPASKFGVRGFFRSARARTLDIGVRCNLLAPWFVDTPLIAPVKNAMAARGLEMSRLLSFASMESCVEAASLCAVDSNLHGTCSKSCTIICH